MAFDSDSHNMLIHTLAHIGICGSLLQWLIDYLQNRHQPVVLDGESSSIVSVSSGVPQGSILGPLLFIIFMNSITDLPLSLGAKLVLYADDILLYKAIDSPNDVLLLPIIPRPNSFKSPGQRLLLQFLSLSTLPKQNSKILRSDLISPGRIILTWSVKLLNITWVLSIESCLKHHPEFVMQSITVVSFPNWITVVLCGIHTTPLIRLH